MHTRIIHWRYLQEALVCGNCTVEWTYTQKQRRPGRFEITFSALFRDRVIQNGIVDSENDTLELLTDIDY